jgi:hypothetical protein
VKHVEGSSAVMLKSTLGGSGTQDVAQWTQIGGGDLKGRNTLGVVDGKLLTDPVLQEWLLYASSRSTVFIQIDILDSWQKH